MSFGVIAIHFIELLYGRYTKGCLFFLICQNTKESVPSAAMSEGTATVVPILRKSA